MAISEKRKKELIDLASNGKFDEVWAHECALYATNYREAYDAIMPIVRNLQKHMERDEYDEVAAVPSLLRIGEIAAKGYAEKFYDYMEETHMKTKWYQLMDVPTRYACGQRIAHLLWEH